MRIVYAVAGITVVILTLVDALWTVLWVDGAGGPFTSRTTSLTWRMVRRIGTQRHRLTSVTGPLILTGTVVGWVLALWVGWVLVFAADPQSLLSPQGSTASWNGRIWFVAYTMFAAGNGDFSPASGLWQILGSLVNGTGFFLITLSVTYLLSVISAVVDKRAFASSVHALGRTPSAMVLAGWNGHDLRSLDRQLAQLSTQLSRLTEQYLSYPVLQYYHAARAEKSPALAVAMLDDALLLLHVGVAPEARPSPADLAALRSTVETFLETLDVAFIGPAKDTPPPPDLTRLRTAGVPTVSDDDFAAVLRESEDRRRKLLGSVRNDGWTWPREETQH